MTGAVTPWYMDSQLDIVYPITTTPTNAKNRASGDTRAGLGNRTLLYVGRFAMLACVIIVTTPTATSTTGMMSDSVDRSVTPSITRLIVAPGMHHSRNRLPTLVLVRMSVPRMNTNRPCAPRIPEHRETTIRNSLTNALSSPLAKAHTAPRKPTKAEPRLVPRITKLNE